MTIASEIIRRAYRESNLIPLGQIALTDPQLAEGLESLNSILLSSIGNEVSQGFYREIIIGGDFDQSDLVADFVPGRRNTRLVYANTDGEILVGLNPKPAEGQRLAIVDMTNDMSTNTITLDGNGRFIEGATTITLDIDGLNRQWMYRSDTGNWVKIEALTADDEMPLPLEFDAYFITFLALRLNPKFSQVMPQESLIMMGRMKSQIRARYHLSEEHVSDSSYLGLSMDKWMGTLVDDFDTGRVTRDD